MPEGAPQKLAMIGFDAANLDYIKGALPSLPNFRRVLESGTLRKLRSPADLLTGSVWPSFFTGSGPGDHGIYHIVQWDPDAMRIRRVTTDGPEHEPFWREMDRRGLRTIALDVPFTSVGELSRGIEIVSWGAHDQLSRYATWPRELAGEVRRRVGKHPMGIEVPVEKPLRERMELRDRLIEGIRLKCELMRWLLTTRHWDFFIGVFGEAHRGGHILWPDAIEGESSTPASALLDVYRALDAALGDILAAIKLQSTTVIIFALHGMAENTSQEHFVGPMMDLINARFAEAEPSLFPSRRPPRRRSMMRILRNKVPPSWQSAIANRVPQAVRDAVIDRALTAGHDWPHTPGIALRADDHGYLRLNLRGREKHGMLEAGSHGVTRYEAMIRESFASMRTLDGTPLLREVSSIADHFRGAALPRLPDLIVRWSGIPPASSATSGLGSIVAEPGTGRGGNHRPDGFQIVLQPGLGPAAEAEPMPITSLAAMILHSFGIEAGIQQPDGGD